MSRLAPYAEQHKSPTGPGDSRPTALQIIKDQNLESAWEGRVVLVTGCSPGGIGPETARAIHATGADVYITARDIKKGEEIAKDILSDGKSGKVEVIQLDLASLESVREAAKDFLKRSSKLNVLINNAGVMACPKGATKDGFETQFGTNFLGHFLLFHLLKPTLLASSEPRFNSRVIGLSSSAHRAGVIQLDDLNFTKREYEPWAAYGQAKLAIIHFANELERRYSSQGMHALSLDPGNIVTPLQKHSPESREMMKVPEIAKFSKSPQQGAATTVWAAVAKEWEGRGGKFLNDCEEAVLNPVLGLTPGNGYSKYAFDPETEKALWIESLKLVGLEDDGSAKS